MPRTRLATFSLKAICLFFVLVFGTQLVLAVPLILSRRLDFLRLSASDSFSIFGSGSGSGLGFGLLFDFRDFLVHRLHLRLRSFLNAKVRMVRRLWYSTTCTNARFYTILHSIAVPRPVLNSRLSHGDIRRFHPRIYKRFHSTSSLTVNGLSSPESGETFITFSHVQRSVKQPPPPQTSVTLLIVITAGTLFALSLLAAVCYMCARCRTRKQRAREKLKEKRASLSPSEREKVKMIGDLEVGRTRTITTTYGTRSIGTDSGLGPSSPSAFEFSPPSPTWRPTLPSLSLAHFASASASTNRNAIGRGLASGRGEILDAETIMREREPGRRRMVFGVGAAPQVNPPAPVPSFPRAAASAGAELKSKTNTHAQIQIHPYAQAQPFLGKVGTNVGMSVPGAPRGVSTPTPLRTTQMHPYRPPELPKAVAYQYCRQSRIVPRAQQGQAWERGRRQGRTDSDVRPATKAGSGSGPVPGRSGSSRRAGEAAGPSVSSAKTKEKKEGERGARIENEATTSKTSMKAKMPVPRIEVHLAGDERNGRGQDQSQGQRRHLNNAGGAELKRSNSALDRNRDQSDSGRPRSGLGISTIDLGVGDGESYGSTKVSPGGEVKVQSSRERSGSRSRSGSRTRVGSTSRNGSRRRSRSRRGRTPSPSSPPTATPSDDDVRLAYTLSVISLQPGSELESKSQGGDSLLDMVDKENNENVGKFRVVNQTQNLIVPEKAKMKMKNSSRASVTMSRSKRLSATQRRSVASPSLNHLNFRKKTPDTGAGWKRQALGAGAIDLAAKSELHDMRSLGSESFDSLIAYLEESAIADAFQLGPDGFAEGGDDGLKVVEDEATVGVTGKQEDTGRVTREDTVHVDEASYEAWLESLNAGPSVLQLAHVEIPGADVPSTPTSSFRPLTNISTVRPTRRGRSASESAGRTRGPPLREQDTDVPDSRRSRSASGSRGHARNKSVAGTNVRRDLDGGLDASIVGGSATTKGKRARVGRQDRALRAEHNSFERRNGNKGTLNSASDSGAYVAGAGATSIPSSVTCTEAKGSCISTRGHVAVGLSSFSVPSTAAQLAQSFPENVTSSSGFASTCLNGNRMVYDDRDGCRSTRAATSATSKRGAKAMPGSSTGTEADAAGATYLTMDSSSKTMVGSVSLTSSSMSTSTISDSVGSNSKANLMRGKATAKANLEEAISSAKYIARCTPTPHLKSAAALSFFSPYEPSSSPSHSRSLCSGRVFEHGHEEAYELSKENESESDKSDASVSSSWGRRSEWGRESLTPRFDHLRAVLEGRFEGPPPPLPLPLLRR